MKTVVLDACVLLRGPVTDFLLNLADQGLFEPIWSSELHEEWGRNLARIRNLPIEKIAYRREQMDLAFPAAICDPALDDLKSVTSACQNPAELKDAHVVATAVSSGASAIITYNLKDFNGRWLKPFGLEAITPDDFCVELAEECPEPFLAGARRHHQSLRSPAYSTIEYLEMLSSKAVELRDTVIWLRGSRYEG